MGEGDEVIEEMDAGGEGGTAEAEIEGAGVGEVGGEVGPESNGGRAVEGYGLRGRGPLRMRWASSETSGRYQSTSLILTLLY